MLSKQEFKIRWSALHSDAKTDGIVGAWLNISYRFAHFFESPQMY